MNAATIAVLWAGGAMGTMKAGDLAAFVGYVTQMLTSLMLFSNMLLTSSRAIVSAKRITEVLDSSGECDPENSSLSVANGSVEFKDITFRHQKGSLKPALEDLSLVIEPGQTVGLVGSAGSGKSTLAHMIPGLLNPDSGQALVDGKDILTYSLKGLRSAACVVLQSSILFSGTIAENLAWGKEGASMEEMRAAAHAAQADLFIDELPEGYETMLSQGGVNLSGGQRQRLCLARAILRSPKIIILDDAASAVDTVTEANIRRNLSSALPGATRVIIAQRIASVKDADKIFVLENGRLAGAGTHDELFESCGIYRDICMTQV
jgi:ATP-binding cassette subfamily B protein